MIRDDFIHGPESGRTKSKVAIEHVQAGII